MKSILFVDDESHVLDGLRRMLRQFRHEWNMQFAQSGEAALRILATTPVDVVVSDMRMPGMNGAVLLAAIRRDHPRTVRIVLSGHADEELLMQTVETAHQYLSKPCDPNTLKQTVDRACALHGVLEDEGLKGIVSQIKSLPSPPSVYMEIVEELRHPDASTHRVGEIVSKDAAMSAKVLQLVNSGFFGLPRRVADATQAVNLLGTETLKHLVLSVQLFSQFSAANRSFQLDALWKHCANTGALAKAIARAQNSPRTLADYAMTAGLLHDVGKLILLEATPERFTEAGARADERGTPAWEEEHALLGATHADVGAYLLGLWGLPVEIVEAVAFHHRPSAAGVTSFDSLTAVHVADALLYESESDGRSRLDMDYVASLGLADRIEEWRVLRQQVLHEKPAK